MKYVGDEMIYIGIAIVIIALYYVWNLKLKFSDQVLNDTSSSSIIMASNENPNACSKCNHYAIRQPTSNGYLYRYPMKDRSDSNSHSICRECSICGFTRLREITTQKTIIHYCNPNPNEFVHQVCLNEKPYVLPLPSLYRSSHLILFPSSKTIMVPLSLKDDHEVIDKTHEVV